MSKPSLSKLIPIKTSKAPRRRSRKISIRSRVSISECIYRTLMPCSWRYSVKSSDIRFVNVVTRTLLPCSITILISESKSSTCVSTGLISMGGSNNPVGLIICSANIPPDCSNSHFCGVAETNTACGRIASHSSNLSGGLSVQDGNRKPCSESVTFLR